MPCRPTISDWVIKDLDGFANQYAQARNDGLDVMADEVQEIADIGSGDTPRDRLRFDARRWYLSKLAPKRYGERLIQEHTGPDGGPVVGKVEVVIVDPANPKP